jgi:hypothetical protein
VVGERQRQRERATEGEIGSWKRVSGGGEIVRVASAREWWVRDSDRDRERATDRKLGSECGRGGRKRVRGRDWQLGKSEWGGGRK